jgi:hypothetical protein
MPDVATVVPAPDAAELDTHTHLKPDEKIALAKQLTTEVLQLKDNEVQNAYGLGLRLARLHHGGLFRSAGAKTWKEYLDTSVKLSRTQAEKWMRVASHFSEPSVETYGIEVLDNLAKSLDSAKQPVPADLSTLTVHTAEGDKHLCDLSETEAEAAFHAPRSATTLSPDDQAKVDGITTALSKLDPTAHVAGTQTTAGARVTISLLVTQVQAMALALSAAPRARKPVKKKPARPAKKAARPAKKKKTRKARR